MERDDEEYEGTTPDDPFAEGQDDGVGDDSGTGAAIALIVALLAFVLAVAFVILRAVLFHA